MEPQIERISACDLDAARQASHIHRPSATVMSHEQISAFQAHFSEAAGEILTTHLLCVLEALASLQLEKHIAGIRQEFAEMQGHYMTLIGQESDPRKRADLQSKFDASCVEFDGVISRLSIEGPVHDALHEIQWCFRNAKDFIAEPVPLDAEIIEDRKRA